MLEKELGNQIISKLRVIHLLEADMNFAFQLFWEIALYTMPWLIIYSVNGTLEVALAPDYTVHSFSKQFPMMTYALPSTMA